MRFLIDANLPRAAIVVCQQFGHQVEFARDIGLASATDEHRLSFRNLIEMAALRALRTEHEFKLSAVRTALDYAG